MCHTLLSERKVWGWNFRCGVSKSWIRFRWFFPVFGKRDDHLRNSKENNINLYQSWDSLAVSWDSLAGDSLAVLLERPELVTFPVGLGVMIQGFYNKLQCESLKLSGSLSQEPPMKNQQAYKNQTWEYALDPPKKMGKKHQPANHQNCTKTAEKMDVSSAMTGHHLGLESLCSILAVASRASTFTQETPWDFNTWDGLGQGNAGPMDTQKWTRRFFGCVEGFGKVMFLSGHFIIILVEHIYIWYIIYFIFYFFPQIFVPAMYPGGCIYKRLEWLGFMIWQKIAPKNMYFGNERQNPRPYLALKADEQTFGAYPSFVSVCFYFWSIPVYWVCVFASLHVTSIRLYSLYVMFDDF